MGCPPREIEQNDALYNTFAATDTYELQHDQLILTGKDVRVVLFIDNATPTPSPSPMPYPGPHPIETSLPANLTPLPMEDLSPAPVLGIVISKDREVLHIEPSSAAEKAGVQLKDIIEQINGIPLSSSENMKEAKKVINGSQKDTKLKMTVLRSGKELELEVTPAIIYIPDHTTPIPTVTPVWPPQDYL